MNDRSHRIEKSENTTPEMESQADILGKFGLEIAHEAKLPVVITMGLNSPKTIVMGISCDVGVIGDALMPLLADIEKVTIAFLQANPLVDIAMGIAMKMRAKEAKDNWPGEIDGKDG